VNRQIGVYVVLGGPYHRVTWHGACVHLLPILLLKWPTHIAFSHYSATDQHIES